MGAQTQHFSSFGAQLWQFLLPCVVDSAIAFWKKFARLLVFSGTSAVNNFSSTRATRRQHPFPGLRTVRRSKVGFSSATKKEPNSLSRLTSRIVAHLILTRSRSVKKRLDRVVGVENVGSVLILFKLRVYEDQWEAGRSGGDRNLDDAGSFFHGNKPRKCFWTDRRRWRSMFERRVWRKHEISRSPGGSCTFSGDENPALARKSGKLVVPVSATACKVISSSKTKVGRFYWRKCITWAAPPVNEAGADFAEAHSWGLTHPDAVLGGILSRRGWHSKREKNVKPGVMRKNKREGRENTKIIKEKKGKKPERKAKKQHGVKQGMGKIVV